ncbi:MAG: hypothetical protein HRT60_10220, partial [Dinoroseobacter sp.]|nr:hypothetical protein [Dinoroseobacter sp.]
MSKFRPLSYSRSARTRTAYIALGASILLWFALGAVQTHWVILALLATPCLVFTALVETEID